MMYTLRPSTNCSLGHRSIRKIQQEVDKLTRKNELAKYFTTSNGKGKIAGWGLELNGILQIFNVCYRCTPALSLLIIRSLDRAGSEHKYHGCGHPRISH